MPADNSSTNDYLRVIDDAERGNWCVMLWCSTCYCQDFRTAVKRIPDLQSALASIDLDQFTAHKDWYSMLRITIMDYRRSLDWGAILRPWLPYAMQHPRFADVVLYHIAARTRCDRETRSQWISACVDLALRSKYTPLIESLIRILGKKAANYAALLEAALELASGNRLLRDALAKVGFIPSDEEIRRNERRKAAGQKLFAVIHRKDISAVHALVGRKADLTVRNQDGRTLLEYSKLLGCDEIVAIIEQNLPAT